MGRMEKYEDSNEVSYSRTKKNEDLYKDVYLNNTLIDFNKIMDNNDLEQDEETKEVFEFKSLSYVEKNYNINDYLSEKRLTKKDDNLPRSLDEEIKKSDSEINELVNKLEQKEKDEDLFNELMPDDLNTTIIEGNNELNSFVSEAIIDNYVMNKDMDETNSFMDLEETKIIKEQKKEKKEKKKKTKSKKNNDLPIIVFCSIALILIAVVIYVAIKVF